MKTVQVDHFLSNAARTAKRSEIRELLKLVGRPGLISFAGGLPSPETFPLEELAELFPRMIREYGNTALQYGPTEGDEGLRKELIRFMASEGVSGLDLENVMIATASQQSLDLVSRVFLSPGDVILVDLPSYLGALSAFGAAGADIRGVPIGPEGIPPQSLRAKLLELRKDGIHPKLLYLIPDFQNPTGVSIPEAVRPAILEIAEEFDLLLVEDLPYRHLRDVDPAPATFQSMDRSGRVISLYSFSKILFPGLRLGWIVTGPEVISRLVVAKQAVDLCTSELSQIIARELMREGKLLPTVARARALYSEKRRAMLAALDTHMDPEWGVRWTRPTGGMFLWLTLPEGLDARTLFQLAIEENVAFVTGTAFHCDGGGANTLRLNFSYPTPEQIHAGIARLARALARAAAPIRDKG